MSAQVSVVPGSVRTKRYVEVVADTKPDGTVTPITIIWDDGRRYHIDKVIERKQAYSQRVFSAGIRYTVRVEGSTTFLWFDKRLGAWFVEAKA